MTSNSPPEKNKLSLLWLGFGQIGRQFSTLSSASSFDITALTRNCSQVDLSANPLHDSPNLSKFSSSVHYLCSSVQETHNYEHLFDNPNLSVVISLTPKTRSDQGYREAYVEPIVELSNLIKRKNITPKRVVFVSSTSVYAQDDGSVVDESSATTPVGFAGARMLEAEQVLLNACSTAVIVRFSGIYGPGRFRLLDSVLQGQSSPGPGFGVNAYTNRIHQYDCAQVIAHVLTLEQPESIYIGSDDVSCTGGEIKRYLASAMGVEYAEEPILPDNKNQLRYTGKRLSNQRLKNSGYEFLYPSYREGYPEILEEYLRSKKA